MTDVLVVGAGIVGLSAGWHLARNGSRVTVVEAGEPLRFTSRAAAAMIAPVGYEEPPDDEFLRLRVDAHADWSRFAAELFDDTGVDPAYQRIGSLVAAFDDDGQARARSLRALHAELGIASTVLGPDEVRKREPLLRNAIGGLWVPGEGCVDPDATGRALVDGIRSRQGIVRTGVAVSAVRSAGDRVVGVTLADGTRIDAGLVVVAAGAASTGLAGIPDAARFPLRAVKGQSVLVRDRADRPTVRTVLRAGVNLVPRGDGRLMIAGTVEDGAGLGDRNTVAGMYEVLDRAIAAVPAVRELALEAWCVGQRPVAADDAPVLGGSGVDGLWWATGHSYYGILLSGLTGWLIAAAVHGDPGARERIRLFEAARFRAGTPAYTSLTHDRHA